MSLIIRNEIRENTRARDTVDDRNESFHTRKSLQNHLQYDLSSQQFNFYLIRAETLKRIIHGKGYKLLPFLTTQIS